MPVSLLVFAAAAVAAQTADPSVPPPASQAQDLQAKVDALYDEARKKGVESGELP